MQWEVDGDESTESSKWVKEAAAESQRNAAAEAAGNPTNKPNVGDRVEVRISRDSVPGMDVDMISVHNCEGGRWLPAKVQELDYRQDEWCPGFFCAYGVRVQGDVGPDGKVYVTPVREDDDRCIRAAPPPAARPPPRFAIGTRVTNGKLRDVEAYHTSSLYRDAHHLLLPQSAAQQKRGPLD